MILPVIIISIIVIVDQASKIIAQNFLFEAEQFDVIPHVLGLTYVRNEGAAFGMLSNHRWVFMIFSTVAIGLMIYFLLKSNIKHPLFIVSISMLIGGGIGNMIDRILRGYVIDFFKFLFVKFAVFNVADCFVTVGAVLLAIYLIFMYDDKSEVKTISDEKV